MNILVLGGGHGSWQMRGVQLGRAMGARVTTQPTETDWALADVVVLVKHGVETFAKQARRCGVPIVWDVLDIWQQSAQNADPKATHVARVRALAERAHVSLLVGATQAMADDLGGVYVPHHARIGLAPTQPREHATTVAYDGRVKYLGAWKKRIEEACQTLGLTFVTNPPDLSKADVLVSFRGGRADGWVCRQWKSGVKVVNAIVAGRPIVCGPSAAEAELNGIRCVVHDAPELTYALASAGDMRVRLNAYQAGVRRASEFHVDTVAAQYRQILQRVAERRAA